ncbi:uncharacterized mitochondrial protein AtMg00810-like [Helianthus annuus]|uniref:uncharacterized mitochondrial protein AtMg00810-like n=1 Tax=Helianthus annuus TaxID=4232 RepID=UPI000B8F2712|nr:uncharacterized mitochondrial protein AtMg00810-like [Helianthus annuus]
MLSMMRIFRMLLNFNEFSEDDEYHDANQEVPATILHGSSEATPPVDTPATVESIASSSSPVQNLEVVVDLNFNNLDDIIFGSTNDVLCGDFERVMHEKFEMSAIGEMTFFLGLQVQQTEFGIFIHQTKYVGDILSRFQMSDTMSTGTPFAKNHGITLDLKGESIDSSLYCTMFGSLMYLTASRPDIMYPTCLLARYQANPKVSHLMVVKRTFRYLKGFPETSLWYPRDNSFDLIAYSDFDFGGCKIDGKSTTAGFQFLGNLLVTWQCKKQTCVATSTCEAEYIATSSCCSQVYTDDQRANLFPKAFDKSRFDFLLPVNGIKGK